jgi:hypothetical protein
MFDFNFKHNGQRYTLRSTNDRSFQELWVYGSNGAAVRCDPLASRADRAIWQVGQAIFSAQRTKEVRRAQAKEKIDAVIGAIGTGIVVLVIAIVVLANVDWSGGATKNDVRGTNARIDDVQGDLSAIKEKLRVP